MEIVSRYFPVEWTKNMCRKLYEKYDVSGFAIYDDLFTDLASKHDNFHYHTAISRERRPDGSRGCYIHQLVDEQIAQFGPILENPRTVLYICGLAGMQIGLYQAMARHKLNNGYFRIGEKLSGTDPANWEPALIRRGVKATGRCMVEVY